jgi:hypothetical protein
MDIKHHMPSIAMFVWLISHQLALLFSHNKPVKQTSKPNEQAKHHKVLCLKKHITISSIKFSPMK